MGHNSVNIIHGVRVLSLCTSSGRGLHYYLERFKCYGAKTISILIITKGHNSITIVRGVTVLILCTLRDHGLHTYQVRQTYFEWFKSNGADTISILIITKEQSSVNIACGVTVLFSAH